MDNFILSEEQRKELTSISDDINDYTIASIIHCLKKI